MHSQKDEYELHKNKTKDAIFCFAHEKKTKHQNCALEKYSIKKQSASNIFLAS